MRTVDQLSGAGGVDRVELKIWLDFRDFPKRVGLVQFCGGGLKIVSKIKRGEINRVDRKKERTGRSTRLNPSIGGERGRPCSIFRRRSMQKNDPCSDRGYLSELGISVSER